MDISLTLLCVKMFKIVFHRSVFEDDTIFFYIFTKELLINKLNLKHFYISRPLVINRKIKFIVTMFTNYINSGVNDTPIHALQSMR